jgi:hypothetical protein
VVIRRYIRRHNKHEHDRSPDQTSGTKCYTLHELLGGIQQQGRGGQVLQAMYSTNSHLMIQTPIVVVGIDLDPQCNLSTILLGGHGHGGKIIALDLMSQFQTIVNL